MKQKRYWSKSGIISGIIFVIVNILLSFSAYNDPAIKYPEGWSGAKIIFYPNVLLGLPMFFVSNIFFPDDVFINLFVFLSIYWFFVGTFIMWIYNILPKIGKIFYLIFIALIILGITYTMRVTFFPKSQPYTPQPLIQQDIKNPTSPVPQMTNQTESVSKYNVEMVNRCVNVYQSEQKKYNSQVSPGYIVIGFPENTSLALAKAIIKSHNLIPRETNVGYHSYLYADVVAGQEFLWACRLKQDSRIKYTDPSPAATTQ